MLSAILNHLYAILSNLGLPGLAPALIGILGSLAGSVLTVIARLVDGILTERRERVRTDEAFRKLNAKKHNEHIKLLGSFCNTVGAAIIGAAFIVPYIKEHAELDAGSLQWLGGGLVLPAVGQIALRFMKSEG